jgi:hypothetical protein
MILRDIVANRWKWSFVFEKILKLISLGMCISVTLSWSGEPFLLESGPPERQDLQRTEERTLWNFSWTITVISYSSKKSVEMKL